MKKWRSSFIRRKPDIALLSVTLFCVLWVTVISTLSFTRNAKIGYVHSAEMLEKYPAAIAARGKLEKQVEQWQENINVLEAEINRFRENLKQQTAEFSATQLAVKNDTLRIKQENYLRYRQAVQDKKAQLDETLMAPVLAEINGHLNDFGEEYGYKIIFGTLSGGNILFAQDAVNLTDDFLAYVNDKLN